MTTRTVTYDPAKWKLVPVKIADEMCEAVNLDCQPFKTSYKVCAELWDTLLAAAPEHISEGNHPAEKQERCPHCDGTGDVHSADGEWRGTCTCEAGSRIREGGDEFN